MSGHSKWSSIKRKKAKEDSKRGKIFSKLSKAIMIAAKQWGGNPETNLMLANAIERAKQFNLPQENIERAIKKATGETNDVHYENLLYEGYGPGGVAVIVETMTDNKNRTAAEMRHLFSRNGGNIGESGCVAWIFDKKGVINVKREGLDEDKLLMIAIEAGAEDMEAEDDFYKIYTSPEDFKKVLDNLTVSGIMIEDAELTMRPTNFIHITEKDIAKRILRLMNELEEHNDVQEVYANFEIDNDILRDLQ